MRHPHERHEQLTVAHYLDLRRYVWYHVPNGGSRNVIEARNLRAQGVKAGVPDIWVFPARWTPEGETIVLSSMRPVVIELKRVKGSAVSPEQRCWIAAMESIGYRAEICRGAGEALAVLKEEGY